MASEQIIQKRIMLEASKLGCTVWRNNTGVLKDAEGRPVKFGLCVGSSDLIGIYDGRFLAIEVKRPGKKLSQKQEIFINHVKNKGGIAFRCDDEKKLKKLLDEHS